MEHIINYFMKSTTHQGNTSPSLRAKRAAIAVSFLVTRGTARIDASDWAVRKDDYLAALSEWILGTCDVEVECTGEMADYLSTRGRDDIKQVGASQGARYFNLLA